MAVTWDPWDPHGRGARGLIDALMTTDQLAVIVSGQVGDCFKYLNEGSFLVSGITIQRSSARDSGTHLISFGYRVNAMPDGRIQRQAGQ